MNVLVLGSNGQVGSSIKKISINYKYSFIFWNRNDLDLYNFKEIKNKIKKVKPDVVINCSAYTDVLKAELEKLKSNTVNNLSLLYLADACFETNSFLIHFSSDYIFNGKSKQPYKEFDTADPINFYGQSKLNGEKKIINSNVKYLIIRTSWVFSEFGKNFFKKIIDSSRLQNDLKIVDDQVGKPTYALELAKIILNNLNNICENKSMILNLSGEKECSWFEFAKLIVNLAYSKKIIKKKPSLIRIKSSNIISDVRRPSYSALDNCKFLKLYKIKLNRIEDNISECLDNY